MLETVAFDSKDFNRSRVIRVPSKTDPLATETVYRGYFTPLGAGITFKNADLFESAFIDACRNWALEFGLGGGWPILSSYLARSQMPLYRAIPLCDKIVQDVQDYVDLAFFSWLSIPPTSYPTVSVGGTRAPRKEIPTPKFLRDVAPYFSYITAWAFFGKRTASEYNILIDGFHSKRTPAWDDIASACKPAVLPRGDECNPFVAFADIVAFLTDVKLGQQQGERRFLSPDNVNAVWEPYSFEVDVRYLDPNVLRKVAWYNDELIDLGPYLKRPVVFFLVDEIEKIGEPSQKPVDVAQTELQIEEAPTPKPRKFRKIVQRTYPYWAVTTLAFKLGGCAQFYDRYTDADKIRDGDVLVYMGHNSKRIASAYEDGFDVRVLSARELRRELGRVVSE